VARVDAVIPTFNAPSPRLAAAISSCLTCRKVGRVIIVDDGSSPPAMLTTEVAADPRVRLVRQSNAGPSAARNRGIELARAEFILFLDDDDAMECYGLEVMLDLADRLGAAAVVGARFEMKAGAATVREVPPEWADRLLPSSAAAFWPHPCFGASGLLVRREALDAGIRFDPALLIGEDRDFLKRIGDAAPIAVCSRPVLTVHIHEGGENLTSMRRLDRRVRDHIALLDRHHDRQTDRPLRAQTLWLLNQVARQRPLDEGSWNALVDAARLRRWRIPLKPRWRVWRWKRAHG
jgi:glycosyltransferase involved in cell wall biosynthesis